MIVVHGKGMQKLIEGVERVTSSDLKRDRRTWSRLAEAFAVIPPLTGEAEVALANYIASHDVMAFVLHRGGVGLEFVRLLFGEDLTLRRVPYVEPPRTGIRPLLQFLERRDVDQVIERRFPDPDTEWPEAGYADDRDESNDDGGRADDGTGVPGRPPLHPLATLGRSTNVCAARLEVGAGTVVLLPLGRRLDTEDARLLEQVAAPPPKKVRMTVRFRSLELGEASIQVDDHDPETRSSQRPAILAAFARRRKATLREIGLAIVSPASLARQNPVGEPVMSGTEVANRIDKMNKHFRDRYGLAYNVVVTPRGSTGVRTLDRRVTLKVEGLPD